MIQRTLVIIKPDGVVRGLVGESIKRFEQRGLKILGMKLVHIDKDFATKHYTEDIAERHGKKVYEMLLNYITEGPVVAFVLEGVNAVEVVRKIVGKTYPGESPVGTIRGDYAHITKSYALGNNKNVKNLVHASGSLKEAKNEINIWFSDSELFEYPLDNEKHIR